MNIKEPKMNESKGKVCMTGKGPDTRQILEAKLFQMGYESVDSVTKDTSILVVDDLDSTSSKMLKAKKLGIKIMLYREFFK
jgi:DNA ligase (NAD+)